jgi:phosphatidylglycerol:prolipoprotein diacylglycerol transferase
VLFYQIPMGDFEWSRIYRVWEGGMSFHGGLLGVVIAYLVFAWRTRKPVGEMFDGLTLATPIGIFFVRVANFINAELYGRVWDGPWAMRFPDYENSCSVVDKRRICGPEFWEPRKLMLDDLRHPSQLYEAFFEGLVMFAVCYWLMLRRGWGGGMVSGAFLMGYGGLRFLIEFTREPDQGLGFPYLDAFTQGQLLSLLMVLIGFVVFWLSRGWKQKHAGLVEPPRA